MNPVKIEVKINIKFMVKLGWKTENIIAAFRNIHGQKPSKKQQLEMDIRFRKG